MDPAHQQIPSPLASVTAVGTGGLFTLGQGGSSLEPQLGRQGLPGAACAIHAKGLPRRKRRCQATPRESEPCRSETLQFQGPQASLCSESGAPTALDLHSSGVKPQPVSAHPELPPTRDMGARAWPCPLGGIAATCPSPRSSVTTGAMGTRGPPSSVGSCRLPRGANATTTFL